MTNDERTGRSLGPQEIPRSPGAPAAARRFFDEAVRDVGVRPEQIEIGRLLLSELVTNTIVHTDSAPVVQIDLSDMLRVSVLDGSRSQPDPGATPTADGGRGIAIVRRLARRWGAECTPTGKVVWFELET